MSRADYIAKYFEKDADMTAADKTPRTDAFRCMVLDSVTAEKIYKSHEQLETELAAKTLELAEAKAEADRLREDADKEWNGKERRCEHDMKWISDWYGDPGVINGTADCSRSECTLCGWVDPNGERPEPDDYYDE